MSFVMSAMPTKAAVFTGARASARGSVRTVRAAEESPKLSFNFLLGGGIFFFRLPYV